MELERTETQPQGLGLGQTCPRRGFSLRAITDTDTLTHARSVSFCWRSPPTLPYGFPLLARGEEREEQRRTRGLHVRGFRLALSRLQV